MEMRDQDCEKVEVAAGLIGKATSLTVITALDKKKVLRGDGYAHGDRDREWPLNSDANQRRIVNHEKIFEQYLNRFGQYSG